jgi:hypothetical protein
MQNALPFLSYRCSKRFFGQHRPVCFAAQSTVAKSDSAIVKANRCVGPNDGPYIILHRPTIWLSVRQDNHNDLEKAPIDRKFGDDQAVHRPDIVSEVIFAKLCPFHAGLPRIRG